ncbi:MAG: conjugal transfer protein MobA [Rikenellaceae bacterium]
MRKRTNGFSLAKENLENRYSVNFTATENAKLLAMREESGVRSMSTFIKSRVFNESFKVIKIDNSYHDYYQKLTTLYGQFRSVGVNYNQVVVTMRTQLSEKRAMAMIYKLEDLTIQLAIIGGEIVQLTNEFREKWVQKL